MPADGDEFLLAFHRDQPGVTSRAFAEGRDADGRSSYDLLADEVPPDSSQILDLGCGDGFLLETLRARGFGSDQLAGVDMSPDEIAAARARPLLAGARLSCERAQALPLAAASFDAVVSHLAFMLMSQVETVVAELARVLAPGGVFATVVGAGPTLGGTFEHFLDLFLASYRGQEQRIPQMGDRRTRTERGLAELFGPAAGFTAPEIRDVHVSLAGPVDKVCDTLATIYESAALPASTLASVRAAFIDSVQPLVTPDGILPCAMAIRLVTTRREGTVSTFQPLRPQLV